MIKGTGVDLISIQRIDRVYRRHPQRFLLRVFTVGERDFISRRGRLSSPAAAAAMASRFAAKEAVLKAIGCGIGPAGWAEVEVVSPPGSRPIVRLHGKASKYAEKKGIRGIQISITHDPPYACAIAVAY